MFSSLCWYSCVSSHSVLQSYPYEKCCCTAHWTWGIEKANIWFTCAEQEVQRPRTQVKSWLISRQHLELLQFLKNFFSVNVKYVRFCFHVAAWGKKSFICWSRLNKKNNQEAFGKILYFKKLFWEEMSRKEDWKIFCNVISSIFVCLLF